MAVDRFDEAGFCVVEQALSAEVVQAFVGQIEAELALEAGTVADSERTIKALSLADPQTWPRGGQRRVVECAPFGRGDHWGALSTSPRLATALDRILGQGAWEIETNTPESPVRYFYAPVVFPEAETAAAAQSAARNTKSTGTKSKRPDKGVKSGPAGGSGAVGTAAGPADRTDGAPNEGAHAASVDTDDRQSQRDGNDGDARPPRLVELMSWKEERKLFGEGSAMVVPPSRWQPVNRRRFRGKGWHIDIGPGFDGSWPRTLDGHPFQGVVLLLVLSDWEVGGGGTCMVQGSHHWVRDQIVSAGPDGLSHDDLNKWCVEHMIARARVQSLVLDDTSSQFQSHTPDPKHSPSSPPDPAAATAQPSLTVAATDESQSAATSHGGEPSLSKLDDSQPQKPETEEEVPRAVQIVARAGDVVIMHPLIIHSGTTNLSSTPRLMANGMARVKKEVFDSKGHPLFQRPHEHAHDP